MNLNGWLLARRVKALCRASSHAAAMLVPQTHPVGTELFSYANTIFCSNECCMAVGRVCEINTP